MLSSLRLLLQLKFEEGNYHQQSQALLDSSALGEDHPPPLKKKRKKASRALPPGWDTVRSCSSGEIFFLQQASLQCQRERPGESESDQHRDDRREQEEELSKAGATEVTSERASEEKSGTEGEEDTILLSQTSQEVEEVEKSRSEVPLGDAQIIDQSGPVSLGQNPTRAKEKSPNKEFKKSGLDGTYWLKEILKSRRNPQKFKRIEAWFENSNSWILKPGSWFEYSNSWIFKPGSLV